MDVSSPSYAGAPGVMSNDVIEIPFQRAKDKYGHNSMLYVMDEIYNETLLAQKIMKRMRTCPVRDPMYRDFYRNRMDLEAIANGYYFDDQV